MSWIASGYVKDLRIAPNGDLLSRDEKFLALILADYHESAGNYAYPSVPVLAADALMSVRHAISVLHSLERNGVIGIRRGNGRGKRSEYWFPGLPVSKNKDAVRAPFAEEKNLPKSMQKGCTAVYRNKEEPTEPLEPTELSTAGAALKAWLQIKAVLRLQLGEDEWRKWVRSAMLLRSFGDSLLIAIPPCRDVIEAARARQPCLAGLAATYGYKGVNFTRYPTDEERRRLKQEYPHYYRQMLGNLAVERRQSV